MRLTFAGTPRFAAVALARLLHRGHDVRLVLTQPDRPSGRGQRAAISPVKELAQARNIALQQPDSLRLPSAIEDARSVAVDAWVVAAYGLILPPPVLDYPALGCLNIHASLLPRWRGAAPIQRALMAGDAQTGVSIMRMDAGLDTGPVYRRCPMPIDSNDTAESLHDRLADLGAEAICDVLAALAEGIIAAEAQPAAGATYAKKLTRADAQIDWMRPAPELERLLRALDPVPGANTTCRGDTLKLWRGSVAKGRDDSLPGTVLDADERGIAVQCGEGSLVVTSLQRPGGRRLEAEQFLRGYRVEAGTRLGA